MLDAYWQARHGNLADIEVPLYVCASWSTQGLHNRGTIEGYRQASSPHKWIEIHGRKEWETYFSREALERQLRFCDHFLKGIDNDWLDTPRVRYELRDRFYDGTHQVRRCLAAAGDAIRAVPSRCGEPQACSARRRAGKCQRPTIRRRPTRPTAARSFALRFDEDTELTGYMKLRLWVSCDASDDLDLFVGIRKFDRRGNELHFPDFNHIEHGLVAKGWLRASHRELDDKRSTPYQPWLKHQRALKLASGEIVPVEIEIWPSSTLFRKGETLAADRAGRRLQLHQIKPAAGQAWAHPGRHAQTVNRGRHVIHAGGRYDSHLLVPVIPLDV